MEEKMLRTKNSFGMLIALGLVFAGLGPVHAAIVSFSGNDSGTAPGDTYTNSAAAEASLIAAAGAGTLTTFEGLALGVPTGVTVASGVTLTLTTDTVDGGIVNTDQHAQLVGFNITSGGENWLQMVPDFDSASGVTATFSFSSGIEFFGFYLTDTETSLPGTITVNFDDGASQSLGPTKNDDSGGVSYFGFFDPGANITSVSINTGATAFSARDIWGIDNVRFGAASVPEPGSLALLGIGLAGFAASRRRKQ
jgi:hypothetical protein